MADNGLDGMTLAVGGSAVGALCALAGSWIRARYGRAKISPQPLAVAAAPSVCEDRHSKIEGQIGNLFARVAVLERTAAATSARLDGIAERLTGMDGKLDRLVERHICNGEAGHGSD